MNRLNSFTLILSNLLLFLPPDNPARLIGALGLMLLPGLIWAEGLTLAPSRLQRSVIGLGLSYSWLIIAGLFCHYLPGPVTFWHIWLILNIPSLLGLTLTHKPPFQIPTLRITHYVLLIVVLYAALFRLTHLGYSEFQDDEVDAMTAAAEALSGHEDALFIDRRKGPAEVLLPAILWQLTATTSELRARLPFAIASLAALLTVYALTAELFTPQTALITAALFTMNGFMVAFARIVQYQSLVIWFSLLALLCAWQWRQTYQKQYGLLLSLFLAISFLAHYDTLLIFPAIIYLLLDKAFLQRHWQTLLGAALLFITLIGLFFIPYTLSAQANRTSQYLLGERIGGGLFKNKLDSFMELTIFYNSIYYLALIGLALAWRIMNAKKGYEKGEKRENFVFFRVLRFFRIFAFLFRPFALILLTIALAYWPQLLVIYGVNLAFVPFAVIFFMAWRNAAPPFAGVQTFRFAALQRSKPEGLHSNLSTNAPLSYIGEGLGVRSPNAERVLIIWLATTFLAYNFLVADPRTHIYVMFTPWLMLVGEMGTRKYEKSEKREILVFFRVLRLFRPFAFMLFALLMSGYLYIVYLRQDIEFMTDWPRGVIWLYPSPYTAWPETDTGFGLVHKVGWKAAGGLYATRQIQGDYQTNGIYEISDWYTYYQLRGCYYQAQNFFALKDRLINPADFPAYRVWGDLALANGKGLTVYQKDATPDLGYPPLPPPIRGGIGGSTAQLEAAFDPNAYPAMFVQPQQHMGQLDIKFVNVFTLQQYTVRYHEGLQLPQPIAITLYWQTNTVTPLNLNTFVELTDSSGKVWAQDNHPPDCGQRPTSTWAVDEVIADNHLINLPADLPSGKYMLKAGLYLPQDKLRLPVLDEHGEPKLNEIAIYELKITN